MMENALKNNFSLEQTTLQLETEGILAQSFRLGKSLQAGDKTGKLSHALERLEEDSVNVTMNKETSLSPNVHYLICKCFGQLDADARFNDIQKEENSFADHEAGHLIWEKIAELLGEGNFILTYPWRTTGSASSIYEKLRFLLTSALSRKLLNLHIYKGLYEERNRAENCEKLLLNFKQLRSR